MGASRPQQPCRSASAFMWPRTTLLSPPPCAAAQPHSGLAVAGEEQRAGPELGKGHGGARVGHSCRGGALGAVGPMGCRAPRSQAGGGCAARHAHPTPPAVPSADQSLGCWSAAGQPTWRSGATSTASADMALGAGPLPGLSSRALAAASTWSLRPRRGVAMGRRALCGCCGGSHAEVEAGGAREWASGRRAREWTAARGGW